MKYLTSSISDKHSDDEDFINFIKSNPEAGFIEFEGINYHLFSVEEMEEDPEYADPQEYKISQEVLDKIQKGKAYNLKGDEVLLEFETEEGSYLFPS